MTLPRCEKCGGKLVMEPYTAEDMLVSKCFVCGKIASYQEMTREESRKLFRTIDRAYPPPVTHLAS